MAPDDVSRDERAILERNLVYDHLESFWEELRSAIQRVTKAHNELHGDSAEVSQNDHDTIIEVSYTYRPTGDTRNFDAKVKFQLDRDASALIISGNTGGQKWSGISKLKVRADIDKKTLYFEDATGRTFTPLELADYAVAEEFFDKKT